MLSYGSTGIHYCPPVLSIPINIINDNKYNNPMNYIFELYFASKNRKWDDPKCKTGSIIHTTTTYYNNFEYPNFLIFLIDALDVLTLKDNYQGIKYLFNEILILDSAEYYIYAYYLMPYENHFVILFKSEFSDEYVLKNHWYIFDNLQDIIFELIGDKEILLKEFWMHAIVYKKINI